MAVAKIMPSISIATRRSTATASKRSPRRCTSAVRWHGPTRTAGTGWLRATEEVFELARCPHVSNDNDISGERKGYIGISIPRGESARTFRGGMLEMDEPEHREYRTPLNAYLSPAAVQRWVPVVDEIVKACLDEKIEDGRIDFVDDLANIVPAVLTLGLLGVPLKDWEIYCEPAHAMVYTPADSPDYRRVADLSNRVGHGDDAPRRGDPRDAEARADRRHGPVSHQRTSRHPTPRSWAC